MTLLKTHTLGPLVEQYERTIAQLNKDLSKTKFDFKQKMEDCQQVILENGSLRE